MSDISATPQRKSRVYYGWVIVVVVALAGFTQSAETYPVLGVFLKPMTDEFGWSRSVFAGAMSIGTILGGFLAFAIGPLVDRYGPRWILTIAFTILGATLILLGGINSLWQFYALQIIGRVMTMGVIAMAMQVIIPKWFVAKRGRTVALGGLGMRTGHTVTPLYVQYLVSNWSWRVATVATGVVIWAISLLPVAMFLRRQPEDLGLLPDGLTREEFERAQNAESGTVDSASKQDVSLSVRQVIRLRSFYLLVTGFSLMFIVLPGLTLHLIPYFTDRGLSDRVAVFVVAVYAAGGGLGSVIYGFLAERYSIRLTLATGLFLMGAGFIPLLAIHSPTLAILWGLYHGVIGGGMFTLQQVVFADYYGRESLGAIRGIVWPVQMGANASGPIVAAVAFDATGSYSLIFSVFGILVLIASICVFLARPPTGLPKAHT